MLLFFRRITICIRSLFKRETNCSSGPSGLPYQQDHALAAFEQGDWLAELELLQLANALQSSAISRGGYDGRAFDLMVAIAQDPVSVPQKRAEQSARLGYKRPQLVSTSAN